MTDIYICTKSWTRFWGDVVTWKMCKSDKLAMSLPLVYLGETLSPVCGPGGVYDNVHSCTVDVSPDLEATQRFNGRRLHKDTVANPYWGILYCSRQWMKYSHSHRHRCSSHTNRGGKEHVLDDYEQCESIGKKKQAKFNNTLIYLSIFQLQCTFGILLF